MGSFMPMISVLLGAVVLCKGWEMPYAGQNMNAFKKSDIPDPVETAQTVGNPLPSAFFEEQVTGGRHPNDDKRYTIEQLNHAARHRNVYFDTVGGDPYGHSSPVLSRSHIAVAGHKKKRSLLQAEAMTAPQSAPAGFFEQQITGGRHPNDDKRYTIAQLNQAARHRNVYYDTVGGDPYGNSSPVLTRSHIAVPGQKKKRSLLQADTVSAPQAAPAGFFEQRITGGRHPDDDKRYTIAQLNHAARHRNVYYDTVGGDPYGNSSPVLTRSHIAVPGHRRRRSADQEEQTLKEKLRLN